MQSKQKKANFNQESLMNPYSNKKTLFYKLKKKSSKEWDNYINHIFVKRIGNGSLKINSFKEYLLQDYIFLQRFLKILSLAAYKATTVKDMNYAIEFIIGIKNELKLHINYCKKFKISKKKIFSIKEKKDNKNYTDYVLKIGRKESILELFVALSPCIIGYGEIGYNLTKVKNWKKNKYSSWVKMYSSDEYQKIAIQNIKYLDMLKKKNKPNINNLVKIFKKASTLEKKFWEMCTV